MPDHRPRRRRPQHPDLGFHRRSKPKGYRVQTYTDGASALDGLAQTTRPTSPSSTSRCRAWTAWSCCGGCARRPTCR